MIETRFGLKYPMPHSLVHIVDNSQYTGDLPVVIAEDPSMYSTIVVTGAPMGEDNKMLNITRSDVLNVAFGLSNVDAAVINKYGQTITYPQSIINQGVPVRFMRVTPEGSTYAVSTIVIQWKTDDDAGIFHVRFKTVDFPFDLQLSKYKNKDRLNAALVSYFKSDGVDKTSDSDNGWHQRVFINAISAGRGKVYNDYAFAINMTSQAKRPPNVRYQFASIDTKTDQIVENFYASLVNINNTSIIDAITPINTVVNQRIEGSSVIRPFLNEDAVSEVYNAYIAYYNEQLSLLGDKATDLQTNAIKTLTINTFDIIFGNYLYNGTDVSTKLPFYQVDVVDTSIPQLPTSNRIDILTSQYTDADGNVKLDSLYNRLRPIAYGVTRDGDSVYVGDIYLTNTTSNNTNPVISIVSSINQYTGAITYVTIPRVYPYKPISKKIDWPAYDKDSKTYTVDGMYDTTAIADATDTNVKSRPIAIYVTDLDKSATGGKYITRYVKNGTIMAGDIVAVANDDHAFDLYMIKKTNATTGDWEYEETPLGYKAPTGTDDAATYSLDQIYQCLDWESHPSRSVGVGNAIAINDASTARYRTGATVLGYTQSDWTVTYDGKVYINDYLNETDSEGTTTPVKEEITNVSRVFGAVPDAVNITNDIVGDLYDVSVYESTRVSEFKVNLVSVANGGSGYAVGDEVYISVTDGSSETVDTYTVTESEPSDWSTKYTDYYTKNADGTYTVVTGDSAPEWAADTYYSKTSETVTVPDKSTLAIVTAVNEAGAVTSLAVEAAYSKSYKTDDVAIEKKIFPADSTPTFETTNFDETSTATGLTVNIDELTYTKTTGSPERIIRYQVSGVQGSIYSVADSKVSIPANYYSSDYGINMTSEVGGVKLAEGSTGFFDDEDISSVEFKYRYSALLVKAYRGEIDPRIQSPTRCSAKFLFDGGTNTIVGANILPYMSYTPAEIINASSIFTDDEKDEILFNSDLISGLVYEDIDVKAAMYDLMIYRCYQGIPEDKRPIGPGSGLSLHLDAGVTEANTINLMDASFAKRFDNPNASWDIGGWIDVSTGVSFTYVKQIVDNLFAHCRRHNINKPYTGNYSNISRDRYVEFFPDIDTTDWELRALRYNSGGNVWIRDVNGNLQRQSQRTLLRNAETSDLVQESNMRTLSRLVYLLQNKIDSYLLEYDDDGVLKTLSDEVNNMFSNWIGSYVNDLEIVFERDTNIDGGDIVVCYVNVVFRGLILRVPIIINVNRRDET